MRTEGLFPSGPRERWKDLPGVSSRKSVQTRDLAGMARSSIHSPPNTLYPLFQRWITLCLQTDSVFGSLSPGASAASTDMSPQGYPGGERIRLIWTDDCYWWFWFNNELKKNVIGLDDLIFWQDTWRVVQGGEGGITHIFIPVDILVLFPFQSRGYLLAEVQSFGFARAPLTLHNRVPDFRAACNAVDHTVSKVHWRLYQCLPESWMPM